MTKLLKAFLLTAAAGSAAAFFWKKAATVVAFQRGEEPRAPGAASSEKPRSEKPSAEKVEADALSEAERALLVNELRTQL